MMSGSSTDLASKGMLTDPGDHFVGRFEVELKFKVQKLDPIRHTLQRLKAKPFTLGNVETDLFLDQVEGQLAASGKTQVLRRMVPSGRVLWIVKGPATEDCVAMDLADYGRALEMLSALGFVEQARLSKRRDIYLLEECHVTLDTVEGLGNFVEVAAMSNDPAALPVLQSKIGDTASSLGLSIHDQVERSYVAMLRDNSAASMA